MAMIAMIAMIARKLRQIIDEMTIQTMMMGKVNEKKKVKENSGICIVRGESDTNPHTIWLFNVAMENDPFIDDFPSYKPPFIVDFPWLW